ncbi:hypothetical protein CY34DRAFT_806168 [Suillus luteus UH-Slu-Lm8-n1]|uniref:Uncharacterized protein n=1 Tax=Suillus luteus UH-Slu-Lm8-n1 TaxID=930992 RepID=A0A0D0ATS3_9AGAM|nr:hypothetical protein CY34DRAFT_806168 [Suillus luteus UH-Slu-Lm8-n1]
MTGGHMIGCSAAAGDLAAEKQTRAFCPVRQQLRQCEDHDERRSLASEFVGVQLLRWYKNDGDKRQTECGRGTCVHSP